MARKAVILLSFVDRRKYTWLGSLFKTLIVKGSPIPTNPACPADLKRLTSKDLEKKGLFGYKTAGAPTTYSNRVGSLEKRARRNAGRYYDAAPAQCDQNVGQF